MDGRESRYVCLCNVHSVVTSASDARLKAALDDADLALPDGFPVGFMMRRLGWAEQQRISGPDLMWEAMRRAEAACRAVYFFGSTEETLTLLRARARAEFPGLKIAGATSPPMRSIDHAFDDADAATINAARPDLVFVGLGCPKQEVWMRAARGKVDATMLGVGAAFDYHAGTLARAPLWMQQAGLEWTHRLMQEPSRLWRRYLTTNTRFMAWSMARLLRVCG